MAQVITRDKHPNADKLSVCRVNDGQGERQIVCGAQNFQAGDKVPLILPGRTLPARPGQPAFTIKVGKIRGVESHGMMCSPQELGLPDPVEGLLILPADAPVGQPFAQYLGRADNDVVYDLEVTPNRPDLNSVIGIAREISALTGNPLKIPEVTVPASEGRAADLVAVRIEDADLCPRYAARVVRGVKIGPSPDWLRQTLEKVGLRSISNVVDVTNYVMLECGQPLHAFDYHLVANAPDGTADHRGPPGARRGEVRHPGRPGTRPHPGHAAHCGRGQRRSRSPGSWAVRTREINERTVDVLIESACFNPTNIRRTSKSAGAAHRCLLPV